MSREVSIPVPLWICAALVVHAIASRSVVEVTLVEEKKASERRDIREMVRDVRGQLGVIEVEFPDQRKEEKKDEDEQKAPDPLSVTEIPEIALFRLGELLEDPLAVISPKDIEPEKKEPEKPREKPPEPKADLPRPEEKKPEEEKKEEEPDKPPDAKKPPDLLLLKDNRISVRQAQDEDQKDNPDAKRLAEKARTVEEETQSADRSTDQVAKNPAPGANQNGPKDQVGNGQRDRVASAEEAEGDPKRAPGESAHRSSSNRHSVPTPPAPATTSNSGGNGRPGPASPGGAAASERAPSPPVAGAPGGAGPRAPEHIAADEGYSDEIPEAAPGGNGSSSIPGQARPSMPGVAAIVPRQLGLGARGGAAGALSLNWHGFVKSVGEEELDRQRAAAGKKIRSERKGVDSGKFQRWLPDIENYDPSVKVGNQTSLNAAQSLFATYLSTIHNAIHPIFAEEFLGLLNSLPRGHELNDHLVSHVEIILSRDQGKVLRAGITKRSGSTMFDAAALEAIHRASPFGAAPDAIASTDGNIYLHWEFHRDPVDACSTRNAHPFILKDPKPIKLKVPLTKSPKQKPTKQEPGAGSAPPAEKPGPLVPLRKK